MGASPFCAVAVWIGAGVFGGYHARQYSKLPGTVLSGVLDTHPDRAATVAVPLGGRGFVDMAEFLEAVDVVTVASPACHLPRRACVGCAGRRQAGLYRKSPSPPPSPTVRRCEPWPPPRA